MQHISKNIIFYITIVNNNVADHSFLRKVIHNVLPQAIIDSVYEGEEAVQYFNNCTTVPHLIFLDQEMLQVSGRDTLELIRRIDGLQEVPVVYLSSVTDITSQSSDYRKQGENHFYSKPYKANDLLNIVGALNSKWLA